MLRALARYLGTGVPVLGVNFGRVGFLSIPREELESGVARVFAGDYRVFELPTLDVEVGEELRVAVNDLVVSSAHVGRMIELEWAVGGDSLGRLACDGVVCATPPGSTGYNFSNGGPVLVWGLDAMSVTFVAPRSTRARSSCRAARSCSSGTGRRTFRRPLSWTGTASPTCRPAVAPSRASASSVRSSRPAGSDVLQPLPPRLCFVACGSRTSSWCARASSSRMRA